MGIGIDVKEGKLVGKSSQNEKEFSLLADTLVGPAADPYHEYGDPRQWWDRPYSQRDDACKNAAEWLRRRQADVISGDHGRVSDMAFKKDGSLCTELIVWIGQDVQKHMYTDVTKDGFYLYSSAKDMDSRDRNRAVFVRDAADAVKLHIATAVATFDRREARKSFMNDFTKEERLERDRLKRTVKKIKDPAGRAEMGYALKGVQNALDAKRESGQQDPAYKALLVPGPMESLSTMKEDDMKRIIGHGIDIKEEKEVKNSKKDFSMCLATLLDGEKADDLNHEFGRFVLAPASPYPDRDLVLDAAAKWFDDTQEDLRSGTHVRSDVRAVTENESMRTEMKIWIGTDVEKYCYTEITKDGFYLYPNAFSMDVGDREDAVFADNAKDAVNIHAATAVAENERKEAKESFMEKFISFDCRERDFVLHEIETTPEPDFDRAEELDRMLHEAEEKIDASRELCRHQPEYQALLIPGPMENVRTMPKEAITQIIEARKQAEAFADMDFADAVASISQDGETLSSKY